MRLIRFPGEPATAAGIPFVHSLRLGEALVAKLVEEIASRSGDVPRLPFEEGVCTVGGEGLAEEPTGLFFSFKTLVACFVTAAATPPPSLPCFRSFLEPGMNGSAGDYMSRFPLELG